MATPLGKTNNYETLDHDINNLVINRSSLQRSQMSLRENRVDIIASEC